MPKPEKKRSGKMGNKTIHGANLGFESEMWKAADALRDSMDAAEYKHVVLGSVGKPDLASSGPFPAWLHPAPSTIQPIFRLWRTSPSLPGEKMSRSRADDGVFRQSLGLIFLKYISDAFEEQHARLVTERASGADPEDPDEYRALNNFWVPPEARWTHLKAQARLSTIGQLVDNAMAGIERDNPALKGVLPKDYARPALKSMTQPFFRGIRLAIRQNCRLASLRVIQPPILLSRDSKPSPSSRTLRVD